MIAGRKSVVGEEKLLALSLFFSLFLAWSKSKRNREVIAGSLGVNTDFSPRLVVSVRVPARENMAHLAGNFRRLCLKTYLHSLDKVW